MTADTSIEPPPRRPPSEARSPRTKRPPPKRTDPPPYSGAPHESSPDRKSASVPTRTAPPERPTIIPQALMNSREPMHRRSRRPVQPPPAPPPQRRPRPASRSRRPPLPSIALRPPGRHSNQTACVKPGEVQLACQRVRSSQTVGRSTSHSSTVASGQPTTWGPSFCGAGNSPLRRQRSSVDLLTPMTWQTSFGRMIRVVTTSLPPLPLSPPA